jgi:hypothetical protein
MWNSVIDAGQLRIFKSKSSLGTVREGPTFLIIDVKSSFDPISEPFVWVDYLLPSGEIVKSHSGDYITKNSEVLK